MWIVYFLEQHNWSIRLLVRPLGFAIEVTFYGESCSDFPPVVATQSDRGLQKMVTY